MGINVFPIPSSAAVTPTGWTAGVAGTFALSSTLSAGTYLIKTDATQTMTISLQDATGHIFSGTIRGGSGFISVPVSVNQIVIPSGLTYPFGIEITPISVTQLAAPTNGALSLGLGGVMTGTWDTAPAGAVSAHLLTTTGAILNFSSTASGATVTVTTSNTTPNALNNFIIAFKNSSGAYGIGATVPYTMPAAPYPYLIEYLVVGAGGSSGGTFASGGGGGAVKTSTTLTNTTVGSSFTIQVAATTSVNSSGASSILTYGSTTITATGGAAGAIANNNGNSGASGSGGHSSGGSTVYSGGTGLDGGNGGASVTPNPSYSSTGGGGGAGGSASGWSSGNGIGSSITGTLTYYAGGGAGGQYTNAGGVGLGGTARGNAGAANSGAGGGAGGGGGGNCQGGSGVVIYAYPSSTPALTTIPGTLTYTVDTTTRAGYRVYKFTAGSGTVTI